jgi:2'-5' RNA ligase
MQSALAEAARSVIATCDGNPTPTEKLHLTLAFLGSVPENRIREITPIAARVALAFQDVARAPIEIELNALDHWRKPEILCATSNGEPPVHAVALAETLKRMLTENGFAPDLKPFRPHATLARKVRRVTRERNMPRVLWSFRDFHLVESRTAPSGALYSSREIYPLDIGAR